MSSTIQYILIICVYFAAMLGIGVFFSKRNNTKSDYFLAKDKLPPAVIAFSFSATQMSGSSYLGCVGTMHSLGLAYAPVSITSAAAPWFCYVLVGDRVCRISSRLKCMTLSDLFEERFGKRAGLASLLIMIVAIVPVLTAQLKAAGTAFETIIGIPYLTTILVFGVIVIIYTLVGGMFAVAWTDMIQGVLMMLGMVMLVPIVLGATGGISGAYASFTTNNPTMATFDGGGKPLLWIISGFLVYGFYQIGGQPAAITRFQTTTQPEKLKKSLVWSVLFQSVVYIGVSTLGICSMALFPDLAAPDMALPNLISHFLPPLLGGVVLAAALGAMMSTIDSVLLMASSLFVNNIWGKALRKPNDDKAAIHVGRIVVIILGLLGTLFAINPPDAILWLVTMGFSLMAGAFTFPLLLGVWMKGLTPAGGFWGMIAGAASTVIWYVIGYSMYGNLNDFVGGIWPAVVGSLVSLVVLLAVSKFTAPLEQEKLDILFEEADVPSNA